MKPTSTQEYSTGIKITEHPLIPFLDWEVQYNDAFLKHNTVEELTTVLAGCSELMPDLGPCPQVPDPQADNSQYHEWIISQLAGYLSVVGRVFQKIRGANDATMEANVFLQIYEGYDGATLSAEITDGGNCWQLNMILRLSGVTTAVPLMRACTHIVADVCAKCVPELRFSPSLRIVELDFFSSSIYDEAVVISIGFRDTATPSRQ